jgi:general secretion pathway protein N
MSVLRRSLVFLLVVFLIAGIGVATLPAATAYRWVADRLGAIRLDDVSGSVWQGRAAHLRVFDRELGALDWDLHALPLLQGTLVADLHLVGDAVTASGEVTRDADGNVRVRAARFRLPASLAAPVLDIPALQLHGDIQGELAQAHLRGAWLEQAEGSLRWQAAAVSGAAQAEFGDLEARFATASDGAIDGEVRDLGGPLELHGRFRVSAGGFVADAELAARDGNPHVQEALRYIGEPQADGRSHLVIRGQVFPWL